MGEGGARERATLWIVSLGRDIEEHAKVAVWAPGEDRAMEAAEGGEIVEWVENWSGDMEVERSRHATHAHPASEREQAELGAAGEPPREGEREAGSAQGRRQGVRVGDAVHDARAGTAWGYALGLAEARHGRAWAERMLEAVCWLHGAGKRLKVRLNPRATPIADALDAGEVQALLTRAWTVVHGKGAEIEVLEPTRADRAE